MKKILIYPVIVIVALMLFNSCLKTPDAIEKIKKSCLYNNKIDYFKRWANTFTEIDTYAADGVTLQTKSIIHPYGYFQLSNDQTYSVMSDNIPLKGTWDITDSCQLVLDPGKQLQRTFNVTQLTNDSLTITRKDGFTVLIQHYSGFSCPTATQVVNQWDNTLTVEQYYTANTVYNTSYIYPVGYFKLNGDMTYNVLSDGAPLNGTWLIDPNGCLLTLDKSTSLERSFQFQTLTTDSLTIWRKDTINAVNYLQHYVKH
ncbi:MAG: hypothetical protein ACHQHN_11255 [Sphingobacteriales bacterium]